MSEALLPAVEIGPADAEASVIWLHGLGADGHDFEPVVAELGLAGVRFVLPHAPPRPVTINNGYVMPAWYDILGMDFTAAEDAAGIEQSRQRIEALIARERARGVPAGRLVLAGFSQGGAIALHTGLRHPEPLAGILALSTYLPLADRLPDERHPANADTPIFMAHGLHDPVVPLPLAEASRQRLETLGYRIEWHTYPMEHGVCSEEIADLRAWLLRVLGEC